MDYARHFLALAIEQLQKIADQEAANLQQAARLIADAIADDKDFLTFGSGHSELVAREAMWRAGGLAPTIAIHDHTGGDAERLEGVAALILGHYTLRRGSAMVVISNSGINPVPIEAAMIAKEAGLSVIAITTLAHSQAVPSRHSGGKKLYQVADVTLDTHGVRGDALIELPNTGLRTGATSTLAGVAIMEALITQAAGFLLERGITPPLLVSSNLPEGDAHNLALKERYASRLGRLPIDVADLVRK